MKQFTNWHIIIKSSFLIALVALVMSGVAFASAIQPLTSQPLNEEGVTEVVVSVFIQDIEEINAARQTFTPYLLYEAVWHDERLAHQGDKTEQRRLSDIWHPNLEFANQRQVSETLKQTVSVSPEGDVTYRQRAV